MILSKEKILAALFGLLWFAGLAVYPLLESTEGRYASVAWDMAHGGSWITPTFNGVALFSKPPLAYWAGAAALKFLPDVEWSVRLPATFALIFCGYLTMLLARRLGVDRDRSRWTFLMAVLSPLAMVQGHMTTGDIFLWAGILLTYLALFHEKPNTTTRVQAGLGLAIGFMAKGHMVLFWVIIPLAAWALSRRGRARPLRQLIHPTTLLVFILLAAPWFAAVLHKYPDLMAYWLGDETAGRVISTMHGRTGPWWYFLPQLPLLMLPWLPELVRGVRRIRWEKDGVSSHLLLILWIVIPLVVFSLSGSKRPNYLLPMVTPLALLTTAGIPVIAGRWLRLRTVCWMAVALAWPFVLGGFHLGPPTRGLVRHAQEESGILACYQVMPSSIEFYHRGPVVEFSFPRDTRFGGSVGNTGSEATAAKELLDHGGVILTTTNRMVSLATWTHRPLAVVANIRGSVLAKNGEAEKATP